MPVFRVWKTLHLHVDIGADSPEEAVEEMLDMDDDTFVVDDCDYGADVIDK